MAKSSRDRDRRALVEQMRKEQQAKERRRTLLVVLACLVVGGLIIGFALVQYLKTVNKEKRDLADIGVSKSAAGCQPLKKQDATGGADHAPAGTHIDYPDSPPAFGKHWGNFLQGSEIRNQYAVADRPELERLVHSLEHGYTILWYDETAGASTSEMDALGAIADKYPVGDKVIIAPWTGADGDAFPESAHVALTHWTGPQNQQGVWEFCGKVSGSVVDEFTSAYGQNNTPEPGSP